MIITKTPFRLSFFGGGTDYNSWFEKKGGLILGAGIAHYCYIMVRHLPQFFEHKSRIVYGKEEIVMNNKQIIHPSVRGCLDYLKISEGCNRPCSFCAIPLMRGKHKSLPIENLVFQAKKLASKGVVEIILIAPSGPITAISALGHARFMSVRNPFELITIYAPP